jgi:hypothetical protein
VTPEVFERVQHVLDVRMRRNQRDIVHNHFLRATLRCGPCRTGEYSRQFIYSQITNAQGSVYGCFLCAGRQDGTYDLTHLPIALLVSQIKESARVSAGNERGTERRLGASDSSDLGP